MAVPDQSAVLSSIEKAMKQSIRKWLRELKSVIPIYRRLERMEWKIRRLERIIAVMNGMAPGERQIAITLDDVRPDHLGRYEFAAKHIGAHMKVLDIACGIGYGNYLMAKAVPSAHILGVDISQDALDFAMSHYKCENNDFLQGDCLTVELPGQTYDLAVSFETIEHVDGDKVFFGRIFNALKPGGCFICSTPNQDVRPFSPEKNPFHLRHYTLSEISGLLTANGFDIEGVFSQYSNNRKEVVEGVNGALHIIVSRRPVSD